MRKRDLLADTNKKDRTNPSVILLKKYYSRISKLFKKSKFLQDHTNLWALVIIVLLNGINWGMLAYFIRPTEYPLILHYNAHFGIDLIGDWWQLYLIPLLGVFVGFFNFLIAWILYNREEKLISHIILLAAIILQFVLIIAAISAILINR